MKWCWVPLCGLVIRRHGINKSHVILLVLRHFSQPQKLHEALYFSRNDYPLLLDLQMSMKSMYFEEIFRMWYRIFRHWVCLITRHRKDHGWDVDLNPDINEARDGHVCVLLSTDTASFFRRKNASIFFKTHFVARRSRLWFYATYMSGNIPLTWKETS